MSDEIDRDSEFEEKILALKIAAAARMVPAAEATGRCLNCTIRVRKGLRWCCPDCRDDWQAMNNRRGT